MKVAVHVRGGPNQTNFRAEAVAQAFEGHKIVRVDRSQVVKDADLVIQTGFNGTSALRDAIERGIPYIIAELSPFRTMHDEKVHVSWGYGGLAGGAWRPEPDEERETPRKAPRKETGDTLIIGQVPNDHSLRGSDHTEWLLRKREEYPEGRIRHHPKLVTPQDTIEDALSNIKRVITFTSTVAVDARYAGCEVGIEGPGGWGILNDQQLAWSVFSVDEYASPQTSHYLRKGYEQALDRAQAGLQEHPRNKVDGRALCEQYYQRLL